MIVLNIGMNVGTETKHTVQSLKEAIGGMGLIRFGGAAMSVHSSDTEPTAVVCLAGTLDIAHAAKIFDLAVELEQEAIACWDPYTQTGKVIGPKAESWGDFNPAFFLLSDGSRLGGRDV